MAKTSVTSRLSVCPVCNTSSLSSSDVFHFFDRLERLEIASTLLARALALAVVAGSGILSKQEPVHQNFYLETMVELVESAIDHVGDMISAYRQRQLED